jgi:hypothetical protein
MATRKQRSKRAKTFRHDYALVVDDEEGNEVEISSAEARAKKTETSGAPAKTPAKPSSRASSGSRRSGTYQPNPPSWNRSLKKGLPWGLVAGVVVTFLLHGSPILGLVYAGMFVPLTYWTDSMVYRRWQRKQADGSQQRQGKTGKTR